MGDRLVVFEDTVVIVMAGGQGERLQPLTRDRSKPAVPFGGMYRIVDFTLSNCLNSGFRKIFVLTQYKSGSLERHLQLGWAPLFSAELEHWIQSVPPQLRVGQRWYEGTADAVFQNVYLLHQVRPKRVLVLSGDHIYKMDYVDVGRDARVSRAIVDKWVTISPGCVIGEDPDDDRRRFTVSPEGVVVIGKGSTV